MARETLKIDDHVVVFKDKLLGSGGKGTVYEGRYDKDVVAVKEIRKRGGTSEDDETKQHRLLQRERHNNVVGYRCVLETTYCRYIVLELCQGSFEDTGAVRDLTREIGAKGLLRQVADGVGHLHYLGILHCDLKPSNILVSLPDTYGKRKAVISDFGSARSKRWTMTQDTSPDTSIWRAPEILNLNSQRRVGPTTDIFSMGCIFYYILTCGGHPFKAEENQIHTLVEANILHRKSDLSRLIEFDNNKNYGELNDEHYDGFEDPIERKERLNWVGYEAGDLIGSMIDNEPGKRPSADAVKNHPFFWQSKKRLEFFQLVSDRLQEERSEPGSTSLLTFLEIGASKIVSDNWLTKLGTDNFSNVLHKPQKGRKKYDSTRLEALLRVIRNTAHHLGQLDPAAQTCIGRSSSELLFYFTDRFPRLLMHVYCVIGETRNREVEVWEELDLRNFYISFATAVPTRPQEPEDESVEEPGQGSFYLWMTGLWRGW